MTVRETLQAIISRTDLLTKEKGAFIYHPASSRFQSGASHNLRPTPLSLATILVHDFLFAKRGIALSKEHKLRKAIEKNSTALKTAKEREKIKRGVQSDQDLATVRPETTGKRKSGGEGGEEADEQSAPGKPRWLRINTIRWSKESALEWLASSGYTHVDTISDVIGSHSLDDKVFHLDQHVENLIAFPSATDLDSLEPYRSGHLISQDKASCFPASLLLSDSPTLTTSSLPEEDFDVHRRHSGARQ